MSRSRILDSAIFDQVAAVIGSADALKLCARFGGTDLYVPHAVSPEHPIVLTVGLDAARLLSANFTGETLGLPNLSHRREVTRRRRQVLDLFAAGKMTARQIALATGYTERHVRNITGDSREDPDQFQLLFP